MNISNQALTAAHSVLGRLQQSVINPIVRLAWDLGLLLSQANFPRRLCMFTSKALNTNPLTIRVDLDSK